MNASAHASGTWALNVGGVAPTYDIPVGRPHAADGFPCVGGVAPRVGDVAPRVGDVAPTYDIPVGRPHVADGFSPDI